jgi:hypothetical protein
VARNGNWRDQHEAVWGLVFAGSELNCDAGQRFDATERRKFWYLTGPGGGNHDGGGVSSGPSAVVVHAAGGTGDVFVAITEKRRLFVRHHRS